MTVTAQGSRHTVRHTSRRLRVSAPRARGAQRARARSTWRHLPGRALPARELAARRLLDRPVAPAARGANEHAVAHLRAQRDATRGAIQPRKAHPRAYMHEGAFGASGIGCRHGWPPMGSGPQTVRTGATNRPSRTAARARPRPVAASRCRNKRPRISFRARRAMAELTGGCRVHRESRAP